MSFTGGLCRCSAVLVQQPGLQRFQQHWLGFPGDYFLNFLSRIFVLWYSLQVNNSLPITFFDWHTILSLPQREPRPSSQSMLGPELSCFAAALQAVIRIQSLLTPRVPTAKGSSHGAATWAPPSCTPQPQFYSKGFVRFLFWSSRFHVIVLSVV